MEDERIFSAKDVQDVAGLSYRQIHDWDARGSLPHSRDKKGTWRRFSFCEIFALTIVNEIHEAFGVPVKRLKFVAEEILQPEKDHFQTAAQLMLNLGVGVWLLTDLEETFTVVSELELPNLAYEGFFGGDDATRYVSIKLNPLVNRILGRLPEPRYLDAHGLGTDIAHSLRKHTRAQTFGEVRVLQAIRTADFRKVEVTLDSGEVRTIRTTAHRHETAQLAELLAEHNYQKLIVTQSDGRVVAVEQLATEKVPTLEEQIRVGKERPSSVD